MAVIALLAGVYLAGTLHDENVLKQANRAGRQGDYAQAISEARRVTRAPTAARARAVEAFAALAAGRLQDSVNAFAAAVEAAPNDWKVRRGYAEALRRAGFRGLADRQLARAVALNPALALPPGFRG